jgi:alginate O-acetyltransferase complex protein AlgF
MKILFIMLLVILAAPDFAKANEDSGLYDPAPPPGSAFVRFANDSASKGSKEIKANTKRYDYVDHAEITPYFALLKGNINFTIAEASQKKTLEDGKFYTAVYKGGSILIFDDTANANMAKSQVTFYNLSDKDNLSVKTSNGKIEVVGPTSRDKSAAREINPVKVPLAIYDGDKMIKDLGNITLERGKTYNVFAFSEQEIKGIPSVTNTSR